MSGFSGAVKIGDLNDYIAPSQSCVVNVNGTKLANLEPELGEVQLQTRASKGTNFPQTLPDAGGDGPVKVSLHDCLACSGCITSAETMLLQHQSAEELLTKLLDPATCVVISLSPQSVASLAAVCHLEPAACAQRLTTFLKQQGVKQVFDVTWARDVSLIETAQEFLHRFRASCKSGATELAVEVASGNTNNEVEDMAIDSAAAPMQHQVRHNNKLLPMLASACPGWVCYAEKTHGDFILPYISTAKSPQAVMGTVLKRWWCKAGGINPENVYHCAIMPCYDKKLEASRDDFKIPGTAIVETDCVLATTELWELLQSRGVDLASLPATPLDAPFQGAASPDGRFHGVPGGSGGYLEHVFRVAAREIYGNDLPTSVQLQMIPGRNPDIKECHLSLGNGQHVLKFAAAFGFRNIQGLMRKIKTGKCDYDYVEVMACPSGCLNGGGQIKPAKDQTPQALIEELELSYHAESSFAVCPPEQNPAVKQLYSDWQLATPYSQPAQELFHTTYRKVEKLASNAIADW